MGETKWFSTRVRLVCLIEGVGATRYADSVYLLRAEDFAQAQTRAVQIGREQEEEYRNEDGNTVRWRLKELVSLDLIDKEDLDGVEVYSEPSGIGHGESYPFAQEFLPERSEPTQTL